MMTSCFLLCSEGLVMELTCLPINQYGLGRWMASNKRKKFRVLGMACLG
jgi:hypothetical protein